MFRTVSSTTLILFGAALAIHAQDISKPGSPDAKAFLTETEQQAGLKVELRGRNVPDDWASLMSSIMQSSGELKTRSVTVVEGDSLCSIMTNNLRLPGCSQKVVDLAAKLNGGETTARIGQEVKIPDYALTPATWTVTFDTAVTDDQLRLTDFQQRWGSLISEQTQKDTRVQLKMSSYYVFVDTPLKKRSVAILDQTVPANPVVKSLSVPNAKVQWLKKLYSVSKLEKHFDDCQQPGYQLTEPLSYYQLFGDDPPPTCASQCLDNDCPRITLLDTAVYRHEVLKSALEIGGIDSGAAAAVGPQCPHITWPGDIAHGTMLASIMAARKTRNAEFVGLAPSALIRSYDYNDIPNPGAVADIVNERANDVLNNPQLFVFASAMTYPKSSILAKTGQLKDEGRRRTDIPALAAAIGNHLPWVTAVGQSDNGTPPHQISKLSPETPMNLGDERSVIVVTSCDPCSGPDAKVWDQANYSSAQDGLVSIAAPGGTESHPIPGVANQTSYSEAWGTSQATSVVGGVAAALMSCYPHEFDKDGRFLKSRLLQTSDPFPNPGPREQGLGVLNAKRAFLDPSQSWIDTGNGPRAVSSYKYCANSPIALQDSDKTPLVLTAGRDFKVGQILFSNAVAHGDPQWTVTYVDIMTARRLEYGPGAWVDNQPILQVQFNPGEPPQSLNGYQIKAFVPSLTSLGAKPEAVQCSGG